MKPTEPERKSEIAAAIEARVRPLETFDITGFFGLADKPIPKIGIRILTLAEQRHAIEAAHKSAESSQESARTDQDLIGNEKTIEALFQSCRDAKDQRYPAFPGPLWMRDNLTGDQAGVLLNLVADVRRKHGPSPSPINESTVDAMATIAVSAADHENPESVFAGMSREDMVAAFILLALKHKTLEGVATTLRIMQETPEEAADEAPQEADDGG